MFIHKLVLKQRKYLNIGNSLEIAFEIYFVITTFDHRKNHTRKYLASTPSFSAFNFLLLPNGPLNRPFSIQNILIFTRKSIIFEKISFSFSLLALFIVHHPKVTSTLYTCLLTNSSRHAINKNPTRRLKF